MPAFWPRRAISISPRCRPGSSQIERQKQAFSEELVQVDQAHWPVASPRTGAAFEHATRRIAAQRCAGEQVFGEFHRALDERNRTWFPQWSDAAASVRTSDAAAADSGPEAIPFGEFEIPLEGKLNAEGPASRQSSK